jgi:outer membrane protein assembly factor BamA
MASSPGEEKFFGAMEKWLDAALERLALGIDLFARETLASPYLSYGSTSLGTNLKMGVPLHEDLSFQLHYSV